MKCKEKTNRFEDLFNEIEGAIGEWAGRIREEYEEAEEKAEVHPVIAYQYQKGLLTAFAIVRNIVHNLKPIDDADAMWMIRDWIESLHAHNGENDTYLRALHASEEDARDICYTAFCHLQDEFGLPDEEDEED